MSTVVEEVTKLPPTDVHGNELVTHIINPPNNLHIWFPGMTSTDVVKIAREKDLFVITLCQKKVFPKNNPDKLKSCQACFSVARNLMQGAGE